MVLFNIKKTSMIDFLATLTFFFAVIDPIGTIPVFLAVTKHYSEQEKRKIALQAIIASACILIFFVIAGEFILDAMAIPLSAFRIAGGIILFLFALSMIFGESKPDTEIKLANRINETAIFPLATPSIAGPGAMLAVILMTENKQYQLIEQVQTVGVVMLVLLITLIFMLCASWIHRFTGNTGASVISRIMGFIFASGAVNHVLAGIKSYFVL